jgi:hypothetical protein
LSNAESVKEKAIAKQLNEMNLARSEGQSEDDDNNFFQKQCIIQ